MVTIYNGKTKAQLKKLPIIDWANAIGNLDTGSVPINPIFAKHLIKTGIVKPPPQKHCNKSTQ